MTLVAHWPFTEDSGSTVYDYSGNGHNGAAHGAGPSGTGTTAAPLGETAYDFDGTDDYVGPNYDIGETAALSVSVWFRLDSADSNTSEICGSYDGTNAFQFRSKDDTSNAVQFYTSDGTVYGIQGSTPTISTNAWYHLVGTYDPSGGYKLYINGTEKADSADTTFINPSNTVYIGAHNNQSSVDNPTDGQIYDFRVYDRALTPGEVQYLYTVTQQDSLRTNTKTS